MGYLILDCRGQVRFGWLLNLDCESATETCQFSVESFLHSIQSLFSGSERIMYLKFLTYLDHCKKKFPSASHICKQGKSTQLKFVCVAHNTFRQVFSIQISAIVKTSSWAKNAVANRNCLCWLVSYILLLHSLNFSYWHVISLCFFNSLLCWEQLCYSCKTSDKIW